MATLIKDGDVCKHASTHRMQTKRMEWSLGMRLEVSLISDWLVFGTVSKLSKTQSLATNWKSANFANVSTESFSCHQN